MYRNSNYIQLLNHPAAQFLVNYDYDDADDTLTLNIY